MYKSNYKGVVTPNGGYPRNSWGNRTPNYQPQRNNNFERVSDDERIRAKNNGREVFRSVLGVARQKVNGKDTYICPYCGNGSGEDGTGAEEKTGKDGSLHLFCPKCWQVFDVFNVLEKAQGAEYNFRRNVRILLGEYQ